MPRYRSRAGNVARKLPSGWVCSRDGVRQDQVRGRTQGEATGGQEVRAQGIRLEAVELRRGVRNVGSLSGLPRGVLEPLATQSQVQKSQTEAIQTKFGIGAGAGIEAIVKLTNTFNREQSRQTTTGVQATLTVTENLLHPAIDLLLAELAQSPWFVVIFYDDLDQALTGAGSDEILTLFRRVLELRPCIALVHVRTECCVENLEREITENVTLHGQALVSTAAPVSGFDYRVASRVVAAIDKLPRWFTRQALLASAGKASFTHRLRILLNPVDILEAVNALIDVQDEAKAIALASPSGPRGATSDGPCSEQRRPSKTRWFGDSCLAFSMRVRLKSKYCSQPLH